MAYARFDYCVVVDDGVRVAGAEEMYKGGVRGSSFNQAVICVRLMSENDLTAFQRKIYLIKRRVLVSVGPLVDDRVTG